MSKRRFKDNKSNTYQALWIGLGNLSSFGIAIISAAILSRYLDKTEYGTYRQVLYVYNTLLIVFTAGLPRVFNYFLPRFDLAQGKEIVMKITKVLFLTGLAFSLFLFGLSGVIADVLKNPELARGLKYFAPVPMLMLPTLGIEGIFSTYRKTIYIAIYSTLSRTLMLIFIVAPVILFRQTYLMAIYGWMVSSALILILAFYFKNIPFRGIKQVRSGLGFKEILAYSLPLVSASLAGIVWQSANQFYVSRFFGAEVFAEFSNGFIELPIIHMITGAASTVLMPLFSKAVHDKAEASTITNLWRSALQKSVVLIYPIVIYFLFFSREVVTIVFSDAYADSSKFFTAAIVINLFKVINFSSLLLAMGKSRYYARLHYVLAISTWVSQYFAVLIFDTAMSVALCYVVISIGSLIAPMIYVARLIKVSFFTLVPVGRILVISLHACLSILPVYFLFRWLLPEAGNLIFISAVGVGYLVMLVLTSSFFKINYWDLVRPLLNRKKEDK